MMEITVGDRFKVVEPTVNRFNPTGSDVIYTVTKVEGRKVWWDCVGKTTYYKIVNIGMIEEHVNDIKDLIKI